MTALWQNKIKPSRKTTKAAQQNCGSFPPKMPWNFTVPHLTGRCLVSTDSLRENTRTVNIKSPPKNDSPSSLLYILIRDNCCILHIVYIWFCLGTTENEFTVLTPGAECYSKWSRKLRYSSEIKSVFILKSCLSSLFFNLLLILGGLYK